MNIKNIQQQCQYLNQTNKMGYCQINNANQIEVQKQILFLQQKYEKIKRRLQHKRLLGDLSPQDIQQIGNVMNVIAMKYSQEGKNKVAEDWLRRCLKHAEISSRVRIVTYNNLACVYKQANDIGLALFYIKKAQKEADQFCFSVEDKGLLKVVTDCSLNLCAILSAMGEHYKALRQARKALTILKSCQNSENNYFNQLYPIIRYNQAVQLERLNMYEQALEAYTSVQTAPKSTKQLQQRSKKAIRQIKVKMQSKILQQKHANVKPKKVRLSLPKFCFQINNKQQYSYKSEIRGQVMKRKCQSLKKQQVQNSRKYETFGNSRKENKIQIKIGSRTKTVGRIKKNVLLQIQNC